MSGVATSASKSRKPPWIFSTRSSAPDVVRARLLRFLDLVAAGDDGDALRLARAVRQDDRAAHHLVRVLRVDPEQHRDVDGLVELRVTCTSRTSFTASASAYGRASTFAFAARNFLPLLGIILLRRASDPGLARISDCSS